MSVKVSLSNEVSKDKSFPKLMISGELIVFFVYEGAGVVLRIEGDYKLGEYRQSFYMYYFTDYEGAITLINE
jgi:hypothetical protein